MDKGQLMCWARVPALRRERARGTRWAARVKQETDRQLYRFRREPAGYNNSEGYFRMLMLVTVLQQDLGAHYNMQRVQDIDFRRSQDLFIHGMIGDSNGGTCVSMPVGRKAGHDCNRRSAA